MMVKMVNEMEPQIQGSFRRLDDADCYRVRESGCRASHKRDEHHSRKTRVNNRFEYAMRSIARFVCLIQVLMALTLLELVKADTINPW